MFQFQCVSNIENKITSNDENKFAQIFIKIFLSKDD